MIQIKKSIAASILAIVVVLPLHPVMQDSKGPDMIGDGTGWEWNPCMEYSDYHAKYSAAGLPVLIKNGE